MVGNGKSGFPNEADKQHKEERETKRAPIDEALGNREEADCGKQSSRDQEYEVTRNAWAIASKGKCFL